LRRRSAIRRNKTGGPEPPLSSSLSQTTAPAAIPVHGWERARSRLPSRQTEKVEKGSPEAAVPQPLISRRQEMVPHMRLRRPSPSLRDKRAKVHVVFLAWLHAPTARPVSALRGRRLRPPLRDRGLEARGRAATRRRACRERVGLIFTHNLKALLAAIVPAQTDRHAEGCLAFVIRGFDHFRARAASAQYRTSRKAAAAAFLSPLSKAARCAVSKWLRAASMAAGPAWGHEIAVRRYRPVRTSGCVILSFLDERAAHCRFPVLPELRFDFSASIRFEASAFVRRVSKLFAASHSSERVLR
jgi:hypothetical protein